MAAKERIEPVSSMVLVSYSDSEEESWPRVDISQQTRKRKHSPDLIQGEPRGQALPLLPPLPPTFHSLYATNARTSTSDDPELHDGRKRQNPHIEGKWPTHVFLEWYPSHEELDLLDDVLDSLRSDVLVAENESGVHSLLRSGLRAQLPLHISLSAPLALRTEQKGRFAECIEIAVKNTSVRPFKVEIDEVNWAVNNDKTRFFLVLQLKRPHRGELSSLLTACNDTATRFGLPGLYEETKESDCFHISIAWSLNKRLSRQKVHLTPEAMHRLKEIRVDCSTVKFKIGNVVTEISLRED